MRKIPIIPLIIISCLMINLMPLKAQNNYPNHSQLTQQLKKLAAQSSLISLKSLTKTAGGKDVWALTIAEGDASSKPGIAVVGGIDGSHLLSVEMAIRFAEDLVINQKELLKTTTFYVFPNMSPDATEQYFASLKYNRKANASSTDDDRDGSMNEDPFEDLNKDGIITMMRIEDPTGNYIVHPADERILIPAKKGEGQKGIYKVFTEGFDNDKDGAFNEDGDGGIQFNKNMSYKFPYFQSGAGEHPVSENENRALLDFLYEQWNLFAIISLGPQNNLSAPLKYNAAATKKRVITSILKEDAELNKMLSEKYNEITGFTDGKLNSGSGGDFFQWAYFHFGKLSLSTPGWWAPEIKKAKDDSVTIENKDKNPEVNFLRWAEKESLTNYFTEWTTISHPDFPGKKVEVGGVNPYVMMNPPFKLVDSISLKNNAFIYKLAKIKQNIKITNVETKVIDKLVTRITVDIYNEGILPTHTELGQKSRWLRRVKADISLNKEQLLISGKKIELINRIDGDQSVKLTWLVSGKGTVKISAGAPHTGIDTITVNLNK